MGNVAQEVSDSLHQQIDPELIHACNAVAFARPSCVLQLKLVS